MGKIKKFLTENKIYFETIMAVALASAGVLLSISANNIGKIQNEISTDQKEIEIETARPYIDISLDYDSADNVESINIYSIGGKINTFSYIIKPTVYYRVGRGKINTADLIEETIDDNAEYYRLPYEFVHDNKRLFSHKLLHTRDGLLCQINCNNISNKVTKTIEDLTFKRKIPENSTKQHQTLYEHEHYIKDNDNAYYIEAIDVQFIIQLRYTGAIEVDNESKKEYCETYIISPNISAPYSAQNVVVPIDEKSVEEFLSLPNIEFQGIYLSDNDDTDAEGILSDLIEYRESALPF